MKGVRGLLRGAIGLSIVGCTFGSEGAGVDAPATGTSESSATGEDDGSSNATADPGSTGVPVPPDTMGGDETTGVQPQRSSCAEVLLDDPDAPSGTYTLWSPFLGLSYEAHCEMHFEGGGWTLVGRSREGASGEPMGWGVDNGGWADFDAPYSLNVLSRGLVFTEILVARSDDNLPIGPAYVIRVPAGFLVDYPVSALVHMDVRTVAGECDPDGGPTMLRRVGYTANVESFYLRDVDGNDVYGLRSDGFELRYEGCSQGADLHLEQGVLYVR